MAGVTYFGTSINDSPTIVLEAGAKIENIQGIALGISDGKLALPEAGANVIGLSLFTNDETAEVGDDVTVQVKDIGKWVAGAAVAIGDELTTDAAGKAVKAQDGNFITAVALSAAAEAGTVLTVQIIKAGYKGAAGGGGGTAAKTKLSELEDVEIASPAAGQVLTYDDGSSKWKNQAATEPKVSLSSLTDVQISSPTDTQVLTYVNDDSKWENKAAPAGGA